MQQDDVARSEALSTLAGAVGGSAAIKITLARDFTTLEPKVIALYEAVLDELEIGTRTELLDVGCGPGLFLRLATARGAAVTGIDPDRSLIDIARDRVPDAHLVVGEMESLPFAHDSFDVVTRLNVLRLAADPGRALSEASRVARPGATVTTAAWGRAEQCEATACLEAVGRLLRLSPRGAPDPLALSADGTLERLAERAGLDPDGRSRGVLSAWGFPDEEAALRALRSIDVAGQTFEIASEDKLAETLRVALAPYRTSDGGYRLENTFSYLVARA